MHSTPGHPRDQFICAQESGWIGTQRSLQSQAEAAAAGVALSQHDLSGKGGGGWRWWAGMVNSPDWEYYSWRDHSYCEQRKEKKAERTEETSFLLSAVGFLQEDSPRTFGDVLPHSRILFSLTRPKLQVWSIHLPSCVTIHFFSLSTGFFYVHSPSLSDEAAKVRETKSCAVAPPCRKQRKASNYQCVELLEWT